MKKSIFFTIIISLLIGVFWVFKDKILEFIDKNFSSNLTTKTALVDSQKRDKNRDKNLSKENLVVSIHGEYITKDDLPQEYKTLNYEQKKRFLSRYIYLKVALDTLKDKKIEYKKEIDEAIEKEKNKLKRLGVKLSPLEELILEQDITFKTIAFYEVAKKDRELDKKVEEFYKKNEKNFEMPDSIEVSHISINGEKEAKKVLKELTDKNITIEDFVEYAKKYSKDYRTLNVGGYVGKVGEKELGEEFFKEIWDSNISSGVYPKLLKRKKNYYHILYVFQKIPKHKKSIDEERENIEKFLLHKSILGWKKRTFQKADKNASVKVYDIKVDY